MLKPQNWMRIPLLFLVSLISLKSFSQILIDKSLRDYSHIIVGYNNHKGNIQGTGFVIFYQNQFYLITNYHIFTAKCPDTGLKTEDAPDTNTSVVFYYVDKILSIYGMYEYPLFNKIHVSYYQTFSRNNSIMDLAVMPIILPENSYIPYFTTAQIDMSKKCSINASLDILGFPSYPKDKFGRTETINTKSIDRFPNPNLWLQFADTNKYGFSGAPVYLLTQNNQAKLVGVCTGSVSYGDDKERTGYGAYMRDVIEAIKTCKKRKLISNRGLKFNP